MILVLVRNEETRKRAATRVFFWLIASSEPKIIRFDFGCLFWEFFVSIYLMWNDVDVFVESEVNDQIGLQIYSWNIFDARTRREQAKHM